MAEIFLDAIVKIQDFARKNSAPFIAKVYRDKQVKMWKDCQTLLKEFN